MVVLIQYCQYCRKDGTYNMVAFDTKKMLWSDKRNSKILSGDYTFVEAHQSKDVDSMRQALIENGYSYSKD